MSVPEEKYRQFIIGLEKLTRETGIEIAGCGCCGSPFLDQATITSPESGYKTSNSYDEVEWIDPSDIHDWENHRAGIIKETR